MCLSLSSLALAGDVPDPKLTPGVVRDELTLKDICETAWGRDRRHVTEAMKREVRAAYRSTKCRPDRTGRTEEIDHLIPRSLGGADLPENLWKQCYAGRPWNATMKDRLETRLSREVCAGTVSLEAARTMMIDDWRKAWAIYFQEK